MCEIFKQIQSEQFACQKEGVHEKCGRHEKRAKTTWVWFSKEVGALETKQSGAFWRQGLPGSELQQEGGTEFNTLRGLCQGQGEYD